MADNDESKTIIAEIRATIDSWKPLPAKPSEFIDPKTFTGIPMPGAYLVKIGDEIKVRTDYIEDDLSITEKDLIPPEGRLGVGREFFIMLQNRLSAFKKLLDEAAAKEQEN
jgi:hypothetical protein